MNSLLIVHSSGRVTRSITRRLADRFAATWSAANPHGTIVHRDVGLHPPSTVSESWIAAAFADPASRTSAMHDALRESERLLDEVEHADGIVIGAPLYNFGMPAQLKAWFDQIIRVGRTFAFTGDAADPYRPLLTPKPVVVLVSAGDAAMLPGGSSYPQATLEPHLTTLLHFNGLNDVTFIRVGDEEKPGDSLQQSIAAAEQEVDRYVTTRMTGNLPLRAGAEKRSDEHGVPLHAPAAG
ncbi:MAG TPA: NAD(P)H-dependent oxidoreductase [Candidatus Synoicihabitans sp.]|nr:NAD(P)H-dependent oxidoreductase [Candidatus Synoicihabitans sp.]